MRIQIGPITKTAERFPGDSLAYLHADLILAGKKIGSVHQSGYAPQWAYSINHFRWQPENLRYAEICSDSRHFATYGLLFDGAAYDTAELARDAVERQLSRLDDARPELERIYLARERERQQQLTKPKRHKSRAAV